MRKIEICKKYKLFLAANPSQPLLELCPIFVLACELIKSEIRWKYQKFQQFYDLPCLMSKMTDFHDFTDFNAALFLYELVDLIIIISI